MMEMFGIADDIKHERDGIERELKRIEPILRYYASGNLASSIYNDHRICRLLREAKEKLMEIVS